MDMKYIFNYQNYSFMCISSMKSLFFIRDMNVEELINKMYETQEFQKKYIQV